MLEYGEILRYLAKNPPQIDAERQLHASLLELLAKCLRMNERVIEIERWHSERRIPLPQYPQAVYAQGAYDQGHYRQGQYAQERRIPQERRLPHYPQQRRLPVS
jgi:hypothetical protein